MRVACSLKEPFIITILIVYELNPHTYIQLELVKHPLVWTTNINEVFKREAQAKLLG